MMSHEDQLKREILDLLEQKEAAVKYNKVDTLYPDFGHFRRELYPQHIKFMNQSAKFSQIAFVAANRIGKTLSGATLASYHMTGIYPDWYIGRKFLNATSGWAAGRTGQDVKDVQQFELLGELDDIGTGTIPRHLIVGDPVRKAGVSGAVESFRVRHVSGGISKCTFKSYEQGREGFQGTKKQWIWLDEEPRDINIYSECLTRTMDLYAPGVIFCTFTPLFGLSDLVLSFLPGGRMPDGGQHPTDKDKYVVSAGWDDVPHLNEQQKINLLASYLPHERLARSKGIPSIGAGAVYPYAEDDITCEPFKIPEWWPRAYGLDVGWNKTAALWIAIDPDSGNVYAYSEYYKGQEIPAIHTIAIKARGAWIPGAIDPGSTGTSGTDGKAIYDLYEADGEGLILELADNAVDAGIYEVRSLMESGQFKIFTTLKETICELRVYGRDENGKVIKKNDHLMDAMRYAIRTARKSARTPPELEREREYDTHVSASGRNSITGY